jgi:hypothetical protein
MSDKFFHESNPTSALRSWVLWQMLRGMGYAALFALAIGLIFGALWAVGQILPEESKQAPSPYSQLMDESSVQLV